MLILVLLIFFFLFNIIFIWACFLLLKLQRCTPERWCVNVLVNAQSLLIALIRIYSVCEFHYSCVLSEVERRLILILGVIFLKSNKKVSFMDTTQVIYLLKLQVQQGRRRLERINRHDTIVFTTTFASLMCKSLHRHMWMPVWKEFKKGIDCLSSIFVA